MSSTDLLQKKKGIQAIEGERKRLIDTLTEDKDLIEGSLTDILVKCGRAGCHCEKKAAHTVTRLAVRENGQIKIRVVRVDDRDPVRKLVRVHKEFKEALRKLSELESRERKILKAMKKARHKRYA